MHPNARITMMAFVGDATWDSFSEGAYAYRGGLRDAVRHAGELAKHSSWMGATTRDGQPYTHIGVVVFGRDEEQPDRVIHRSRIERWVPVSTPEGEDILAQGQCEIERYKSVLLVRRKRSA